MRQAIRFLLIFTFSLSALGEYWPTTDVIGIDFTNENGTAFILQPSLTTKYQPGQLYYFRDNDGNYYQGVFESGDGANSHWTYIARVPDDFKVGDKPSETHRVPYPQPNAPLASPGYLNTETHRKAAGVAVTTGVAHAVYKGIIFNGSFRRELQKYSAEVRANEATIRDNTRKIMEGVATKGASYRKALDQLSDSLKQSIGSVSKSLRTQYNSPDPELVTNLRELEEIFETNRSTEPHRMEARIQGLKMLRNADPSSSEGETEDSQAFLRYAEAFADIAVGLDPITGPIRDTYEAFTGNNLITGEKLDDWSRAFAIIGAVTFGYGSKVGKGIRTIAKINKALESEKALVKSLKINTHVYKRARLGNQPTSRTTYHLMIADLRKQMSKPVAKDLKLSLYLEEYWRPAAEIGNGSTPAAYRWERLTGEKVGDKFHDQKMLDSKKFFRNWLANHPNASANDIQIAKDMLKDIESALGGY